MYMLDFTVYIIIKLSTLDQSRLGSVSDAAEVQPSGQTETNSTLSIVSNDAADNLAISDSASQFSSSALNIGNNNNNDVGTSTVLQSEINSDPIVSGSN